MATCASREPCCDSCLELVAAIAHRLGQRSRQHFWATHRRTAVTGEFLAQAQAEFPPN